MSLFWFSVIIMFLHYIIYMLLRLTRVLLHQESSVNPLLLVKLSSAMGACNDVASPLLALGYHLTPLKSDLVHVRFFSLFFCAPDREREWMYFAGATKL